MNAQIPLSEQDFLQFTLGAPALPAGASAWQDHGLSFRYLAAGLLQIEPLHQQTRCDLILSSGIHGNETAPIELVNRLVNGLREGRLPLAVRLLVIFGNIPAMQQGVRFIDENLNRLFKPGVAPGVENPEQCRAAELMRAVDDFYSATDGGDRQRIHLDLHTAIRGSEHDKFAVHPYLHGQSYRADFMALLAGLGCTAILLSHQPTGTFSYFSSRQHAAQAATVELGKAKPFGENCREAFVLAEQTLTDLLAARFTADKPVASVCYFQVCRSIIKQSDAFQLCFADNINNFTGFTKGSLLCQDGELSYFAEHDGEAIVFPNAAVAPGQRALLTLKQVADPAQLSWASD